MLELMKDDRVMRQLSGLHGSCIEAWSICTVWVLMTIPLRPMASGIFQVLRTRIGMMRTLRIFQGRGSRGQSEAPRCEPGGCRSWSQDLFQGAKSTIGNAGTHVRRPKGQDGLASETTRDGPVFGFASKVVPKGPEMAPGLLRGGPGAS